MAISRSFILKGNDAGRFLIVQTAGEPTADTSDDRTVATRYPNLATFDGQVASTYWYPNQWGDESKTLLDAAYGYEIRDKYFSDAAGTPILGAVNSPNVAAGRRTGNSYDRSQIIFSEDMGAYIYVPNTGDPVGSWDVYITSNPYEATRFDNLVPVQNWLTTTTWGNVNYGYRIIQYAFTKGPTVPQLIAPSVTFTFDKTIDRAYVCFNAQQSQYLYVANPLDPIPSMTLSYVNNPWEATRFDDLTDFAAIVNGRPDFFGSAFRGGWENYQYFFTQSQNAPTPNEFDTFFNTDECGYIGGSPGIGFLIKYAERFCYSWKEFYSQIWYRVFGNPYGYFDNPDCFRKWFEVQDHTALESWLYELWGGYSCGEGSPIEGIV
jgi:hypothetical protein